MTLAAQLNESISCGHWNNLKLEWDFIYNHSPNYLPSIWPSWSSLIHLLPSPPTCHSFHPISSHVLIASWSLPHLPPSLFLSLLYQVMSFSTSTSALIALAHLPLTSLLLPLAPFFCPNAYNEVWLTTSGPPCLHPLFPPAMSFPLSDYASLASSCLSPLGHAMHYHSSIC